MRKYARQIPIPGALVLLGLLLSFASCKKEVVPPDIKEEPKFYTESKLNGEIFRIDAGEDDYRIVPDAWHAKLGQALQYNMFTSTLTNDEDSFTVLIKGREFGSPFDVASEVFLDAALSMDTFYYRSVLTFPGAYIEMKRNGKWYVTPEQQLADAYFIIKQPVEPYQPPGASHSMRKVEATFKCLLLNPNNLSDQLVIEDGKATLLFTYETK